MSLHSTVLPIANSNSVANIVGTIVIATNIAGCICIAIVHLPVAKVASIRLPMRSSKRVANIVGTNIIATIIDCCIRNGDTIFTNSLAGATLAAIIASILRNFVSLHSKRLPIANSKCFANILGSDVITTVVAGCIRNEVTDIANSLAEGVCVSTGPINVIEMMGY